MADEPDRVPRPAAPHERSPPGWRSRRTGSPVVDSVAEFLAPVGRPIVLTQVENELAYDAPEEYVRWAGDMATRAVANALEMAIEGFPRRPERRAKRRSSRF